MIIDRKFRAKNETDEKTECIRATLFLIRVIIHTCVSSNCVRVVGTWL